MALACSHNECLFIPPAIVKPTSSGCMNGTPLGVGCQGRWRGNSEIFRTSKLSKSVQNRQEGRGRIRARLARVQRGAGVVAREDLIVGPPPGRQPARAGLAHADAMAEARAGERAGGGDAFLIARDIDGEG
jgi:hypothetical protein